MLTRIERGLQAFHDVDLDRCGAIAEIVFFSTPMPAPPTRSRSLRARRRLSHRAAEAPAAGDRGDDVQVAVAEMTEDEQRPLPEQRRGAALDIRQGRPASRRSAARYRRPSPAASAQGARPRTRGCATVARSRRASGASHAIARGACLESRASSGLETLGVGLRLERLELDERVVRMLRGERPRPPIERATENS